MMEPRSAYPDDTVDAEIIQSSPTQRPRHLTPGIAFRHAGSPSIPTKRNRPMKRMRRITLAAVLLGFAALSSPAWAQSAAPDLESLRRDIQNLRAVIDEQRAAIAELRTTLRRLEQAVAEAGGGGGGG